MGKSGRGWGLSNNGGRAENLINSQFVNSQFVNSQFSSEQKGPGWRRHSPPDIGGVDATSRRSREASFNGADGVVENGTSSKECILKHSVNPNHPVCAAAVASHLFLNGAATPPVSVSGRRGIALIRADIWNCDSPRMRIEN